MCDPRTNLEKLAAHMGAARGAFLDNEWGLHPNALMFGWVEQESSWNPWASREEPAFYRKYIAPKLGNGLARREGWQLATSFGLLQVMGVTAREMGYEQRYLPQLVDPSLGLFYGVKYLLHQKRRGDGTWSQGLAAYNGGLGGNRTPPYRRQEYVDEVVHRARRYAARA